MRYWGWRPLVFSLWISVLITACSETQQLPVFTPTSLPAITLTQRFATAPPSHTPSATPQIHISTPVPTETPAQYRANAKDTWVSIANHFGISPHLLQQFNGNVVLKVGDAVRIPAPIATYPPQSITYTPPTCYETPTDALFCLGEVTNTQSYAIGRVTLRLTLTRPDGRELTSQVVHIAARWLPPGQSAPYRAIFNDKSLAPMDASNAYYGMVVTPLSADRIPDSIFGRFVTTLEIVDEGMRSQNNYVIMSGTIVNRGLQVVENVRVVVTLYNAHGQVAGYRMVEVPHVEAGESLPLRMVMLPTTDAKLARPLSATWFVDVPVIP